MHSIFARTHAQSAINAATISTQTAHTESRAHNVLDKSPSIVCFSQNNFRHWFSVSFRTKLLTISFAYTQPFRLPPFSWRVFVCVSFTKSQIQFHKSKSNFHLTQTLAHSTQRTARVIFLLFTTLIQFCFHFRCWSNFCACSCLLAEWL